MKQSLILGNTVDDGQGDYLNKGGKKIVNNFDDLYYQLGDGLNPHAAGAWKTINVADHNAIFGQSYAVNTSTRRTTIRLPKGTVNDYNKVIRARDVFGTWRTNPVLIIPATGDTIKGSPSPVEFSNNFTDLELVYCSPGRWEYVPNKQVDKMSNADMSAVIRKEYIATQGQIDFLDIFNGQEYNTANIEVYQRGNLLYYGEVFNSDSDFGSPGTGSTIVPLDGKNIRLKNPCVAGDTVIIVSYVDGLSQWRSTYNRLELRILDQSLTNEVSVEGSTFVGDLSTLRSLKIVDFGYESAAGLINPNSFEVYVNGVFQTEAGTGGLPAFICEGADADDVNDCIAAGGSWVSSNIDYTYTQNSANNIDEITFGKPFEHGDIVTIKWFNNNIGTTLSMDEIVAETDDRYVASGQTVQITGGVRVTDFQNPVWPNIELLQPYNLTLNTIQALFDVMYPVGSVYENFVNPNNPATYNGGFGMWKLQGEKRVTVGWTPDDQDTLFGLNNNDKDAMGNPSKRAGGTGGVRENVLTNDNIPASATDEKVLVQDANGGVIIGGCQFDPSEEGPAYQKYREDYVTSHKNNTPPKSITNIQPYITVYRWMRIA